MREILFRGKSKKTNKWVHGDFSYNYHDRVPQIKESNAWWCAPVIPETVGQYTGVNDKKGNLIFEGDIVKADNGHVSEVVFFHGTFCLYCECHDTHNDLWGDNLKVIGNIHDNPELLKGETK